jgi:signal transduction histidine kinase
MLDTILTDIFIVILTIMGLCLGRASIYFVVIAALLMIWVTYTSFEEEKNRMQLLVDLVLMSLFSVLSGYVLCYLVIFFERKLKPIVRLVLGVVLYVGIQLVYEKEKSLAMCILMAVFLSAGFCLLWLLEFLMDLAENRRIAEDARMTASNISELHEKRINEQLVQQRFIDERNARMLERENICRNIHNSVGHSITAAVMTLDAADMLYDVKPDEARKKMNDANTKIRGSLESIRRAVRVLDEENKPLSAQDLKSEFAITVDEFAMDTSLQIHENYNDIHDEVSIPYDHVIFLTGVLQEMLTNGVKHGNATEFLVVLVGDSAHIRLEVSDNGKSDFSNANSTVKIENGFGLKKIISYTEKCGGKCRFCNENGFRSVVELPIIL